METLFNFLVFLKHMARLTLKGGIKNYDNIKNLKVNPKPKLCILGNGSSLKKVSFDAIDDTDFMVVNRHVLTDDYLLKKPRFYVLADPHFFRHPEGLSIIETIKERTTWEMYLFAPYTKEARTSVHNTMQSSPNIHCVLYNAGCVSTFEKINKWVYMHNLGMPRVQNVMVAAITIAIFLGYGTINLYGVEHSWTKYLFVNNDNEPCLYNPHFYDKGEVKAKTMSEIQHTKGKTFGYWLHLYAYMFDSYHVVKKIAQWNNTRVVNKTPDSFIDAFDRE